MINKSSAIWEGLPDFERAVLLEHCLDAAERLADVQAEELAGCHQERAGLRDEVDMLEGRVERLQGDYNAAAELLPFLQTQADLLQNAASYLGHGDGWAAYLGEDNARGIDDAIRASQKIEAIKALRKVSGFSLRTAKKMVEGRTAYLELLKKVKQSFS